MAKYQLNARSFIYGQLLSEGTVINLDDSFEPGPHMDPLDEAAEVAMAEYRKKKPDATLDPIEATPQTMEVIALVPKKDEEVDLTSLAETKTVKAEPGPTDGGKVK